MPDFEKMYFHMAGKMADAIETLDKVSRDLKVAQIEGEDSFISQDDIPIKLIDLKNTDKNEPPDSN